MKRVTIVSLGRAGANGEVRRVASWRQLFEHVGAHVDEVRVTPNRVPHVDGLMAVLEGRAAPERLAWSGSRALGEIRALRPDVILCVSSRAFDPRMLDASDNVVLDFVDSLSRSYRDRSDLVVQRTHRLGYQALARAHRRVENTIMALDLTRIAAGCADARALDAEWIPIIGDPLLAPIPDAAPEFDIVFFGTLRYPPNIDALERLASVWRIVQRDRPHTTALIAGSSPTSHVRALCERHGWTLRPNFTSLPSTLASARLAVVPLQRTAGIQIKVLDAAWLGMPQVVSSAALAGYAPGMPIAPFDDDDAFAAEILRLLDDPDAARTSAEQMFSHVRNVYGVRHWAQWALRALDGTTPSGA